MAIKTFSDGVALPASDINSYLTNSGLVFVKSQTVGNGVSSVTVTGAFSAEYDNYKITFHGGVSSGNQAIALKLGASVTQYYGTLIYTPYGSPVTTLGDVNNTQWTYIGGSSPDHNAVDIDLFNPFQTKFSTYTGGYMDAGVAGVVTGMHKVAASYTSFIFSVAGNMTGGTITVYGYRKG